MRLKFIKIIQKIYLMQENKDQVPDFIEKLLRMMEVSERLFQEYPNLINWGNQG